MMHGMRSSRGATQKIALPTPQKYTTSGLRNGRKSVDRNVWMSVSSDFFRTVGSRMIRTPRKTRSRSGTNGKRLKTTTSCPRSTSRTLSCSTNVSKPL
jgi:hypothetical protein